MFILNTLLCNKPVYECSAWESRIRALHACFRTGDEQEEEQTVDAQGKVVYRPSETFKMVHEQETPSPPKQEDDYKPTHSRTFKMLQEKLGAG